MKELDAAAVRRLLSRWDYAPEAIEAYGRAMERAMRNAGAHEALERAVDGYEAGGDMDIRALRGKPIYDAHAAVYRHARRRGCAV